MTQSDDIFKSQVLGHPSALFVLFFTEMWERFSYYGMRALLVLFLVSSVGLGGWDWPREHAMALYGTYLALVYWTPIIGGRIADLYIGSRKAVLVGAVLMTLGHAAMATEDIMVQGFGAEPSGFLKSFLFVGLTLLILGNGFFKPNMTSMVSKIYENHPEKKDGAYTIFYMGVNAGAFLGILLVGFIGEKVSWGYGFGLAGIFMLFGLLQFYFFQRIFGDIGAKPSVQTKDKVEVQEIDGKKDVLGFKAKDIAMMLFIFLVGFAWMINDPISKISGKSIFQFGETDYAGIAILIVLITFLYMLISRTLQYTKVVRDRLFAIMIFAFFAMFFWASFEQSGGSMTIFAKDYTQRIMSGNNALIFNIINVIIAVVPLAIISWVLIKMIKETRARFPFSNIFMAISFSIIWGIVIWMVSYNFRTVAYSIEYQTVEISKTDSKTGEVKTKMVPLSSKIVLEEKAQLSSKTMTVSTVTPFKDGDAIYIFDADKKGTLKYIDATKVDKIPEVIKAKVVKTLSNEVEVPATWFLILNSLFIIMFAPLFSKIWESRFNPPATVKYGMGLILTGLGFLALAYGASAIPMGAKTASVSMVWLIIAFFLHTLGELSLSPVSLAYVSKLAPAKMIALMFGVWYLALGIANKMAGYLGGNIDKITESHGLSTFFLIFTIVPIVMGLVAISISPLVKKLMHGVK
jgi:POT family proton-dependent oligopeptide transporter